MKRLLWKNRTTYKQYIEEINLFEWNIFWEFNLNIY